MQHISLQRFAIQSGTRNGVLMYHVGLQPFATQSSHGHSSTVLLCHEAVETFHSFSILKNLGMQRLI